MNDDGCCTDVCSWVDVKALTKLLMTALRTVDRQQLRSQLHPLSSSHACSLIGSSQQWFHLWCFLCSLSAEQHTAFSLNREQTHMLHHFEAMLLAEAAQGWLLLDVGPEKELWVA